MGNNCVGSRVSKDCLPQSISNSLWWSRSAYVFPQHTKRSIQNGSKCAKEVEPPTSVQHKAPEPMKIIKDEIVALEPQKVKGPETVAMEPQKVQDPEPMKIVKDESVAPEPQKIIEGGKHKESESTSYNKDSQTSVQEKREKTKPAQPAKPRKPHNVKRLSSAGLQAASVLQTKTGHLKEYYNLGRKLGNGQFGTTFLCMEKGTGKEYACKSIAKRKLVQKEDVEDVRREIQIMHHLAGHANAVLIKGAYEDSVAVHVVMELCAGGELFDRIIKKGHYTERKAAQLARTIVGFVETCHSLGVMHRDLKPENFLFVNEHEDSPLKAIDFGLSTFFKPGMCESLILWEILLFSLLLLWHGLFDVV